MRIVMDLQGAQTANRFRSIGRYSLAFAQAVARNRGNHDVVIALNGSFPDTLEPIRQAFDGLLPRENVRVWYVPGPFDASNFRNTWRRRATALIRESWLAQLNPDVIHVSSLIEGYWDDAILSIGAFDHSTPVSVSLYDLLPMSTPKPGLAHDRSYEAFYRQQLEQMKQARLWVGISEHACQQAQQILGVPECPVVCAPPAATHHFQHAPENGRPIILCPGRGRELEHLQRFLHVYAQLPEQIRTTHQLVLTDNTATSTIRRLQKFAQARGLSGEAIQFAGAVDEEKRTALYRRCRLVVLPSWYDDHGLSALDAMTNGVPVLAAATPELTPLVGEAAATFDPASEASIQSKLTTLLTDERARTESIRHGHVQAQSYSWDQSAQRAITAFEQLASERKQHVSAVAVPRPRLAYVFSSTQAWNAGVGSATEAILELTHDYDLEVILPDGEDVASAHPHYTVRDTSWFADHADQFARVIYHLAGPSDHQELQKLMTTIPGVVVLDDFLLPDVSPKSDGELTDRLSPLYEQHGFHAIAQVLQSPQPEAQIESFPGITPLLREALGVVVPSEDVRALANEWVGDHVTTRWKVGTAEAAWVEETYLQAATSPRALTEALTKVSPPPLAPTDCLPLAWGIAHSFPRPMESRQLLVDVSEMSRWDARTGIQRVVRSLLKVMLAHPPKGYRTEPVYARVGQGFRYARNFTAKFLGWQESTLEDEPIECGRGDVFLGLDFHPDVHVHFQNFYRLLRDQGARTYFVIYDLLPILFPNAFSHAPEVAKARHENWLKAVIEGDGALCISKAVGDELEHWIEQEGLTPTRSFNVDWFHLGADINQSAPSRGMPANGQSALQKIGQRPSFLMVGTVEPRKGQAQTLLAFEQLWSRGVDVNLVLVGKMGWMTEVLAEKMRTHPEWEQRLFWLEGISDEFLEKVYAACTCLIAASEAEGFGLPLIEAAQHALPIIARDIPVFREVAGGHSFFFEGKAPESLAGAIEKWLTLHAHSEHPRSKDMPWLTWRQSTEQLLSRMFGTSASRARSATSPTMREQEERSAA